MGAVKNKLHKPLLSAKKHVKIATRRRVPLARLGITYAVLIILSAFTALSLASGRHDNTITNPFPIGQIKAAPFKLYYPARLPKGYQVDIASAESIESAVVIMRITNPTSGNAIAISQQQAPENFNYNILYNSFEGKKTYKVKLGTVTTGTIDNGKTQIASLVTADKTWIFLTAPASVPSEDLQSVFVNMVH
jgi:hypothetical protein